MRLYEYEGKALVREGGIPTPYGRNVLSGRDACEVATEIDGPVVVKAQVLFGGRGKAGGIRFAATPEEVRDQANVLLGGTLRGAAVGSVLVEQRLEVVSEYYVGITYDEMERRAVVIAGRSGGIETEEAAAGGVEFARCYVDPFVGLQPYMARDIARRVVGGRSSTSLADIIAKLYRLFLRYDAGLVEINPLALTAEGSLIAADCRIEIDDDALFRQQDRLARLGIPVRQERGREPTELEMQAAEIDNIDHRGVAGRVVEFDGDIALIIGGGGASLTVFDAILRNGGRPANYCEIGGNPTVRKVRELTRLLMSKPGVQSLAVVTNVLNNTRVDLVARGVIKGLLDSGIDPGSFPIVVRSSGSWEEDGYRILDKYGIEWFDRTRTMDAAARHIVDLTRRVGTVDGNTG